MKIVMGLFLFILLSVPYAVNGHEIINDGTATLLVHIEPGHDIAIAGKPVVIYVDLKNSEKGFSIEKCNCTLSIEKDEKAIFSQKIVPATELNEFNMKGVPFTFQSEGAYNINVKAEGATENLFTPFEIESPAKVLPVGAELPTDTETNMSSSHVHQHVHSGPIFYGAIIFIIVFMGYFILSNNKNSPK